MSEDAKSETAMQIAASLADDVYKDGVQSSIQTISQALNGIFKAVAHYPRLWGVMSDVSLEMKEEQFREKLQSKVGEIPESKKVLPKPNILGPSIQALEYGIFEDHLIEMFSTLIANAMNSDIAENVHPAFVSVLEQVDRSEALIIQLLSLNRNYCYIFDNKNDLSTAICGIGTYFGSNQNRDVKLLNAINEFDVLSAIDNLVRLKIVEEVDLEKYISSKNYDLEMLVKKEIYSKLEEESHAHPLLRLTYFGYKFIKTCVPNSDLDMSMDS